MYIYIYIYIYINNIETYFAGNKNNSTLEWYAKY